MLLCSNDRALLWPNKIWQNSCAKVNRIPDLSLFFRLSMLTRIVGLRSLPANATPRGPGGPSFTFLTRIPRSSNRISIRVLAEPVSGSASSNTSSASEYPLSQGDDVDHAGSSEINSDNFSETPRFVCAPKYSASNLAAALSEIFGSRSPNIATAGESVLNQHSFGISKGSRNLSHALKKFLSRFSLRATVKIPRQSRLSRWH